MGFLYERDEIKGRVVVTFQGAFQKDDVLAVLEQHRQEEIGSYGVLYDLFGMTGAPTVADMRVFMHDESTIRAPRGPVAILTRDPAMYAMACTYVALVGPKLNILVFRERAEADGWLTAQSKQ